jgi:molybdenum cofactor biosynthesis enzyme
LKLCHPLLLDGADVRLTEDADVEYGIEALSETCGPTGALVQVTRDMALDAGFPSIEGSLIEW